MSRMADPFLAGWFRGTDRASNRRQVELDRARREYEFAERQQLAMEELNRRAMEHAARVKEWQADNTRADAYLQLQQQQFQDAGNRRAMEEAERRRQADAMFGLYLNNVPSAQPGVVGPADAMTPETFTALPAGVQAGEIGRLQRQQEGMVQRQRTSQTATLLNQRADAAEAKAAEYLANDPQDPMGVQLRAQAMALRNQAMELETGAGMPAGMMGEVFKRSIPPDPTQAEAPSVAAQRQAVQDYFAAQAAAAKAQQVRLDPLTGKPMYAPGSTDALVSVYNQQAQAAQQRAIALGVDPAMVGVQPQAPMGGPAQGGDPLDQFSSMVSDADLQMFRIAAERQARRMGLAPDPATIETIMRKYVEQAVADRMQQQR